ncbi:MAG TPA: cob(I)yrinic acid a,c-diamide adenosyltransferase [Candidatus Baltobacteraceae bacterium]|nr:cob(I)yrinic acid a,c-diamide adenosyltransferase [Candidatus Baltobacteraceae bacterium]
MASISTRRGDDGSTSAPSGTRLSKGDLRVEASGCIDELNSQLGVARAFCGDTELAATIESIQRELFKIGSAISTKPEGRKPVPEITGAMVERLDELVERLEATPGITRDWTIPGGHQTSAHFEVARTVCRRAERNIVRVLSSGEALQQNVLKYVNRLSDVLWLCARMRDAAAGVDARLRDAEHPGPPWSRAW